MGVAVEMREPRGFGRCRMGVLTDVSATSLERFITENVEPGSTLVTDGWSSYPQAVRNHDAHKPINVKRSGQPAHVVLPGVHRVASLAKRWVLGTHQGSVADPHLQSYLNEFVFRFNRRNSRSRGLVFYRMLELAVDHDPVRYRELIANSQSKKVPPVPPWEAGPSSEPRPASSWTPLESSRLSRRSRLRWIPRRPQSTELGEQIPRKWKHLLRGPLSTWTYAIHPPRSSEGQRSTTLSEGTQVPLCRVNKCDKYSAPTGRSRVLTRASSLRRLRGSLRSRSSQRPTQETAPSSRSCQESPSSQGGAPEPVFVVHAGLDQVLYEVGTGVAGRYGVHPYPVRRPLGGERLCQHDHARLGHVVGHLGLGAVDDEARHRGDVDDGARARAIIGIPKTWLQ